ncbi:hypothetical protein BCR33DRAFT_711566 [Rhizoclosmatium globosum]|uniref:WAC domain-containing protein n=1 Tax=Rhizoclosmatium globosum TaxID=329046 RepID=A0A1Y2D1S1_9FUNG|nr:hypothetical protein BCR33DRAFT_711566 [Rhizoclosmatium globosum]|eukprot:ORY53231.1 hypothetical protein BCR33DRAFT_711566 [Rhizoclosmatium globosum]
MVVFTATREKVPLLPDPTPEALAALQVAADLAPTEDGSDDAHVFMVPFTGEIFTTYDDYYARMMFYRRRIFSCELTGKNYLSYHAAFQSEKQARQKALNRFPNLWRKCALEYIQFNRCQLEALVNKLFDHLKERLFVGEIVTLATRTHKGAFVKVISLVGPRGVILDGNTKTGDQSNTTNPLSEIPPSHIQYLVHICSEEGDLVLDEGADLATTIQNGVQRFLVGAVDCRRNRVIFNKINIKWYIKESADRGVSPFAPWIVKVGSVDKPHYLTLCLKKHLPPTTNPVGVGRGRGAKSNRLRFPIDDLELLEVAPRESQPNAPALSRDFGAVPADFTPYLIQSWNFLTIYGKPLRLHPFTLDNYIKALEAPKCNLLHETMAALINQACYIRLTALTQAYSQGGRVQGAALSSAIASHTGPSSGAVVPTPTETEGSATDLTSSRVTNTDPYYPHKTLSATSSAASAEQYALFESKLVQLTDFERLAIDQWYKWYIGRWADPARGSKIPASAIEFTVAGRLRAWEVALLGFIRDCVSEADFPQKWKVLNVLVGAVDVAPLDGIPEEEEPVVEAEPTKHEVLAEMEEEEDELEENAKAAAKDEDEYQEDEEEEEEDELEEDDKNANGKRSSGSSHEGDDSRLDSYYGNAMDVDSKEDFEGGHKRTTRHSGKKTLPQRIQRSTNKVLWTEHSSCDGCDPECAGLLLGEWRPASPLSALSSNSSAMVDMVKPENGDATAAASAEPSVARKSHKYDPNKKQKAPAPKLTDSSITEMEYLLTASSRGFATLSASDRLALIKILSEQWAIHSPAARLFSEAMHDKIAEIKKYKRDSLGKDQRVVALKAIEHWLQEDTVNEDDNIPDEHLSASALRQKKLRIEQAKKREQEKLKQKPEKEREKEIKAILEVTSTDLKTLLTLAREQEKKKVEEMEREFYQKQANHDLENTVAMGVSRMVPLVDHYALYPFKETGFSSGLLLVEEFGGGDYEMLEQGILPAKSWSYLATPTDVDKLMEWLDARGIREVALLENLKKSKEIIDSAMTKRIEFSCAAAAAIENSAGRRGRKKNPDPACNALPVFMTYKNLWSK